MIDPFDLVRALYRALNRRDRDALAACYDPECVVEQVFAGDLDNYDGREAVVARWVEDLDRHAGALPGGHRFDVRRVAGIETGWGWVRAEWLEARRTAGGAIAYRAGHSDFWIEAGRIRRHRSVSRVVEGPGPAKVDPSSRRYPSRPIVGVGAAILTDEPRVVLVRRREEPLAGQWSLPGGTLEIGETLEAGTAREIREETGLTVDVGPVVEVFDRILVDDDGRVRYHFVLVDYLCRPVAGTLAAGSDVSDVALADPSDLASYRMTEKAQAVVARAVALWRADPIDKATPAR